MKRSKCSWPVKPRSKRKEARVSGNAQLSCFFRFPNGSKCRLSTFYYKILFP
ncbi:MAG: hypothetical protein LBV02_07970 [Bacteroidales bacterium]|nr:hypothetical protein [Bacteroidales bacterium]